MTKYRSICVAAMVGNKIEGLKDSRSSISLRYIEASC